MIIACAGWEDLNDAEALAEDPLHRLAAGAEPLGSAPTLSRFENAQSRASARAVNEELVEQFIRSKPKPPAYLILDFDATDTPVHGQQEGRFFHGYRKTPLPSPTRTALCKKSSRRCESPHRLPFVKHPG